MARIRSIKPEFPQSESMGRVSRDARLCFIELWTLADDSGRLRGNSRMLASLLFPYDDDAPGLIESWLQELERENCIARYSIEGNAYVEICKWHEHQKIDKPTPSKMPRFEEVSRILPTPPRGVVLGGEGIKDQGRDQGKERIKEKPSAKDPAARKRTPAPKEAESLDSILGGGKGTPTYEAYWCLVGVFGPAKNPAPKTTARLYIEAVGRMGLSHEHIQAKAEALAKATSEPKYLPQLAKWLEGHGYLNPDQQPVAQGKSNGTHHRSASDDALLAQIGGN